MIQRPSPKIPANSMIPEDQGGGGYQYQVVNSRCRHTGTTEVMPFPFRARPRPNRHQNPGESRLRLFFHRLNIQTPPQIPAGDRAIGRPGFRDLLHHGGLRLLAFLVVLLDGTPVG